LKRNHRTQTFYTIKKEGNEDGTGNVETVGWGTWV
jgi:hypothetical protein